MAASLASAAIRKGAEGAAVNAQLTAQVVHAGLILVGYKFMPRVHVVVIKVSLFVNPYMRMCI